MSDDRPNTCRHGVWLTLPCGTCGRTLSDIRLAAVLDDMTDRLHDLQATYEPVRDNAVWKLLCELEGLFAGVRIKHLGEKGE